MTEMEEDTGSWKERCDRYFTSLTDTDVRQDNNDKDTKNGKSDTHNDNTAEKDSWKNLSEFKQDTNRMLRLKKVLHVLDIHGTRILCAGKHWLECVLWFMIISASLAVLVYVIYLQVTDYQKQVNERTFETVAIQNDAMNSERPLVSSLNSARPLVSFCNRNTLKKSAVSGTRFADLANMDSGIVTSQHEHASIKDTPSNVLKSNHKLNSLLKEQLGDELDRFMRELEDDISIKLLSESSNTSLLYSLAMAGTSDILLRYLQPSRTEIQEIGHKMKDMLVRCIVDGRDCRESELLQVPHQDLGNCVTFQPSGILQPVSLEVIFDVESDEYLNVLSQSHGVTVIVHHEELSKMSSSVIKGASHIASPHNHIDVAIEQQISLERQGNGCNQDSSYDKESMTRAVQINLKQQINSALMVISSNGFTRTSLSVTVTQIVFAIANNVDHDEMLDYVAFHLGLHCLPKNAFRSHLYRKACMEACVDNVKKDICRCSTHGSDLPACRNEIFTQYVCVRIVEQLHQMMKSSCNCLEKCRETYYKTNSATLGWPSAESLTLIQSQMAQLSKNRDAAYIRNNLVKITATLAPSERRLIEEDQSHSILNLFARIGGLAAIITGASLITVVEMIYVAIKWIGRWVVDFCHRNDVRKVKRLTDSEITSITWAMHRIKRRDEELQKDIANKRHKRNNGNEPNVLTGTVQNHIARRNSYLAPLSEERLNTHSNVRDQPYKKVPRHSDIDRNTSRKPVHGKMYNSRIARQDSENDILPYHNYVEHSFPRLMRISKNSTEPNESSGGNLIHLEGIYRPADHPVYYERRMYPQIGRLVTPADAIQLYGGTSAYFNTKQISEPMYI